MFSPYRSLVLGCCVLFTSTVYGGAQSPLISSSDPYVGDGWTAGSLEHSYENNRGQHDSVRVSFRGQPSGNLAALKIEAGDWQIDLSSYVTSLTEAYPHRIALFTELDDDGKFHELILDIPYRDQSLGPCMRLEVSLLDGRVFDSAILEAAGELCAQ